MQPLAQSVITRGEQEYAHVASYVVVRAPSCRGTITTYTVSFFGERNYGRP